jgi:hypothetical protein
MPNLLSVLLVPLALACAAACGATSSQTAPLDGGDGDAATEAAVVTGGGGAALPCSTSADGGVRCNEQTQICVNDYAGATGLGTDSCQPLPAACASHPTCACVLAAFRCGITTTCDDGTLPLQVVCQPD